MKNYDIYHALADCPYKAMEAALASAKGQGAEPQEDKLPELLKEKEIAVANHIRNAANDGCQCEPCIAAREAFPAAPASAGLMVEQVEQAIPDSVDWQHFGRGQVTPFCGAEKKALARAIHAALQAQDAPPLQQGTKSIAEDWLNEHKHVWSACDLLTLTSLLANERNEGFELAHESAKCGHARANYRDLNYKRGDAECDSSKCEFCEALLAAQPPAVAGDRERALREALEAARRFVRGRHSTLTYGPKTLLDQIDNALALAAPDSPASSGT